MINKDLATVIKNNKTQLEAAKKLIRATRDQGDAAEKNRRIIQTNVLESYKALMLEMEFKGGFAIYVLIDGILYRMKDRDLEEVNFVNLDAQP